MLLVIDAYAVVVVQLFILLVVLLEIIVQVVALAFVGRLDVVFFVNKILVLHGLVTFIAELAVLLSSILIFVRAEKG